MVTKHFRIQAQILNFQSTRLLWINTYLPTDPLTRNYDDVDLVEILNEIEKIMDDVQFDDVLWCGDLNWDMGRNSGFSDTMRKFPSRIGLSSLGAPWY